MAITIDQYAQGTGTGVTLGASPTQGNWLLAFCFRDGGSIAVNTGAGWVNVGSLTGPPYVRVAAFNVTAGGGSTTVTPTVTSATNVSVIELRSSLGFPSSPWDVVNLVLGVSATPATVTSSSNTLAHTGEFILGACYCSGTGSTPLFTNMTANLLSLSGGDTNGNGSLDYNSSPTSPFQSTASWASGTAASAIAIVSAKEELSSTLTTASITGAGTRNAAVTHTLAGGSITATASKVVAAIQHSLATAFLAVTSGNLITQTQAVVTGSITAAGSFIGRAITTNVLGTGSIAAAGSMTGRAIAKAFQATITQAGNAVRAITTGVLGTGVITGAGQFVSRAIGAILSPGSITATGSATRSFFEALAGSVAQTGALTKALARNLGTGVIAPAGTIAKAFLVALSGSITATGAFARSFFFVLSAAVQATSAVGHAIRAQLGGNLAPMGNLNKTLSRILQGASITPGGTLSRTFIKFLNAVLTVAGTLTSFAPPPIYETVTVSLPIIYNITVLTGESNFV